MDAPGSTLRRLLAARVGVLAPRSVDLPRRLARLLVGVVDLSGALPLGSDDIESVAYR